MWKHCVVFFVLTFCLNEVDLRRTVIVAFLIFQGHVRDGRGVFTKNFFGGVWGNRPPLLEANLPRTTCTCRCGENNEESRIVNGVEAKLNQYPWMARLSYFKRFYCGAMLINDKYVMTAAHCVKGRGKVFVMSAPGLQCVALRPQIRPDTGTIRMRVSYPGGPKAGDCFVVLKLM
ncbi:Phenoloxidase-activating factor 1 [Eumeta japonica]|uniref:Phenoloxidase-activating factor 1 n=1 Tax=Eumeta variegata TaxID=151549 RepID=A0A4C1TKL7_EUMVA|nr:Phenoloxidase-activating factor 1 [Eumeta japonica]